jgi:hypothetical protein
VQSQVATHTTDIATSQTAIAANQTDITNITTDIDLYAWRATRVAKSR